jgi:ribonuclease Z
MSNTSFMKCKIYFSLYVCLFSFHIQVSSQTIKVTLLGTGAPQPSIERFGAATLVEAGGNYFLFDCGRGATQRLWQQKIGVGKVNRLFLTHLHSDHVVGIPDFWLLGLMPGAFGNRKQPFEVWGPAGTSEMMQALKTAYQWDIKARIAEYPNADSGTVVKAQDIKEGVVYDEGGVKITAFRVNHSDIIDSALGYRLDYKGRSVLISGDTRYSENLIKHAKGVDVLIHEVIAIREEVMATSSLARKITNFHTTPEDAGKVFSLAKPRLAVFTHVAIPPLDPSKPPLTTDDIITRTKKYFAGQLAVGEDLMVIEIGEAIEIKQNEKEK